MNGQDAANAYIAARIALEAVPPCRSESAAYGFPKCPIHGGEWPDLTVGYCTAAGREGLLRKALSDLVGALRLEVVA